MCSCLPMYSILYSFAQTAGKDIQKVSFLRSQVADHILHAVASGLWLLVPLSFLLSLHFLLIFFISFFFSLFDLLFELCSPFCQASEVPELHAPIFYRWVLDHNFDKSFHDDVKGLTLGVYVENCLACLETLKFKILHQVFEILIFHFLISEEFGSLHQLFKLQLLLLGPLEWLFRHYSFQDLMLLFFSKQLWTLSLSWDHGSVLRRQGNGLQEAVSSASIWSTCCWSSTELRGDSIGSLALGMRARPRTVLSRFRCSQPSCLPIGSASTWHARSSPPNILQDQLLSICRYLFNHFKMTEARPLVQNLFLVYRCTFCHISNLIVIIVIETLYLT